MRIDVHAHHVPRAYLEFLREAQGPSFGGAHDASTLVGMVDAQDQAGIDVQVLSTGPNSPYLADAATAVRAARMVNDEYAAVVGRHSGRFAAFGSVPLPHGREAAAEAVRCMDELGFPGVHVGCSALGHALDDPAFVDLWAELDARDAVVFVHPGGILAGSETGLAGMSDPLVAVTIGSAAEIAVAALKLVGVARRYRRLRIVIALLGGTLPFLLGRVTWLGAKVRSPLVPGGDADGLVRELRRFSYDVNLLPDPAAIGAARVAFGFDRLLFGSDAPAVEPGIVQAFLARAGITEAEAGAILGKHPRAVFGDRIGGGDGRLRARETGTHALLHAPAAN